MWTWLASFRGGPVVNGLINAYKAKLEAANTEGAQGGRPRRQGDRRRDRGARKRAGDIIAEQGRWWTALPRAARRPAFGPRLIRMRSSELGGSVMFRIGLPLLATVALAGLGMTTPGQAQQASMSFFVTSVGKGNGADLGGLAGADAHCQTLASAAGSTNTLSTTEPGGAAGVNARERVGKGPWQNAKGVVVAKSVDDLHSESNNITKQTALTEKGEIVSGRGDAVNVHVF